MKTHQYLLSAALAVTLMSGAMAAAPAATSAATAATPAAGAATAAATPAAKAAGQAAKKATMHPLGKHPRHMHHKARQYDEFKGLSPEAKVQKVADEAAKFYKEHGFTASVEAYENEENKFFRPDGPYGHTYVVLFDSYNEPGKIEAHPDGNMRSMIAIDMPAVQDAVSACKSGQTKDLKFEWHTERVIARAIPVDDGRYCVVARTNVG